MCAKNDFQNHKQMTKQMTIVVIGSLRVNQIRKKYLHDIPLIWSYIFLLHVMFSLSDIIYFQRSWHPYNDISSRKRSILSTFIGTWRCLQ